MIEWRKGDRGFLTPNLPTAPRAAYRHAQFTLVAANGYRVVLLVDGENGEPSQEIETDIANIRKTRPEPPSERTARPKPRPALPDGYAEVPLWS